MMRQSSYEEGAHAALTKLGFGPEDAHQVLQAVKQRTLPRRMMEEIQMAHLPSYFSEREARKQFRNAAGPATSRGPAASVRDAKAYNPYVTPEHLAMERKHTPPAGIFSIPRGDATSLLRRSGAPLPEFTPGQRKMLDAVAKGHELDELQLRHVSPMTYTWGHVSPEVLFREHNKIVTMPPDMDPVRRATQGLRQATGEAEVLRDALQDFGFTFGEGERLSPAMRKAMTAHLESQYPSRFAGELAREEAQRAGLQGSRVVR